MPKAVQRAPPAAKLSPGRGPRVWGSGVWERTPPMPGGMIEEALSISGAARVVALLEPAAPLP